MIKNREHAIGVQARRYAHGLNGLAGSVKRYRKRVGDVYPRELRVSIPEPVVLESVSVEVNE